MLETSGYHAGMNAQLAGKEEVQVVNVREVILQRVIGINGEIGRNHGHMRIRGDLCAQEIASASAVVIITYSRRV